MMKTVICPECDGWGHISSITDCSIASVQCEKCLGTGEIEVPVTNADHFRTMSDELMAAKFEDMVPLVFMPKEVRDIWMSGKMKLRDAWLEWLRKPYER